MATVVAPAEDLQAGRDYPRTLTEFLEWFPDDHACWRYLLRLRWPDGFSCRHCGNDDYWLSRRRLLICTNCRKSTSVTAGTIFQDTHLPLLTWFQAGWLIATQKNGLSALALSRQLGISYKAAWTLEQKFRRAMVRPGRDADRLSGEIEVDETYVGGSRPGKRGRGAENKQIVIIAVECRKGDEERGLGRTRLRVIPDCTAHQLQSFICDTCEPGSIVSTDGLNGYVGISELGYWHDRNVLSSSPDPAHIEMPAVHLVASLFKRWLLGTHHGGHGSQHLETYLDEFVFHFNRRNSRSRGLLFYRLLELAATVPPAGYERIVWSRRPYITSQRLRGLPRTSAASLRRQARYEESEESIPF